MNHVARLRSARSFFSITFLDFQIRTKQRVKDVYRFFYYRHAYTSKLLLILLRQNFPLKKVYLETHQ